MFGSAQDLLNTPITEIEDSFKLKSRKLDYYNHTLGGLSHSRSSQLHACPRKFEISTKYKLRANRASVTFAYGHAVGEGVQATLSGKTFNQVIADTLIAYDFPIEDCEYEKAIKDGKTIWNALLTVRKFYTFYTEGNLPYLNGWEVAKFQGANGEEISGVELTFVIDLGQNSSDPSLTNTYEGHIDLVLYHPVKNRYMVVELKTTVANIVDEAQYQNSGQALGYGVVLDMIANNLKATSSFDVLYIVNKSKTSEFIPFPFTKTYLDKADWLMGIVDDFGLVERYIEMEHFPKRGLNCYDFFRACEYLSVCKSTHEELLAMQIPDSMDGVLYAKMEKPTFYFTLEEILDCQQKLAKYVKGGADVDMLLELQTII